MRVRNALALVFLFFAFSTAAPAQVYTITDLGALSPTAINSWAQIVGNYNNHAYMWMFGQVRPLGTPPGGTFSRATAINDLGAVAGTADGEGIVISLDPQHPENLACSSLVQPFIWTQRAGTKGLGAVGPSTHDYRYWCLDKFYAAGINDSRKIVGFDDGYSSYQWGFLWTPANGMSLIGYNWPPAFWHAISRKGKLVGQNSGLGNWFVGHAMTWENGVITDLGTLASGGAYNTDDSNTYDGYSSSGNGVNDRGEAVGWSTTEPISELWWGWVNATPTHAVLWSATGSITDLGTLPGDSFSAALKINFFGEVVGSSGNLAVLQSDEIPYAVVGRPFIWSERNGMRDLNTLIPQNSGWVLNSAVDINFWGQIVGQGTRNGQPHGYLLTPRNPFHRR